MPELQVTPFNQRDSRWGSNRHGTSSRTLAQTGCTVSIVASMLVHAGYKTDPGKLNKLLTDNNGYAQGNLIIWSAIARLFPKVKFEYRHYSYNNDLARAWIDAGKMPVIEVGAAPIGGSPGGKHWVGFVGNKKSVDPWTGTIRDTSTWQPTGMALFDYTPVTSNNGDNNMSNMYKGYDLNNPESMKVAVDVLVRVQQGEFVEKPVHEKALSDLKTALEEEKIRAIDKAYNEGVDVGRESSNVPAEPPEEFTINGKVWVLNGVSWVDGKLRGNYDRKK